MFVMLVVVVGRQAGKQAVEQNGAFLRKHAQKIKLDLVEKLKLGEGLSYQ